MSRETGTSGRPAAWNALRRSEVRKSRVRLATGIAALRNASSRNPREKFTQAAPPLRATALSCASVKLRGWFASERDEECETSTGLFAARSASQKRGAEAWGRS